MDQLQEEVVDTGCFMGGKCGENCGHKGSLVWTLKEAISIM